MHQYRSSKVALLCELFLYLTKINLTIYKITANRNKNIINRKYAIQAKYNTSDITKEIEKTYQTIKSEKLKTFR